jgi:hypothetical protein
MSRRKATSNTKYTSEGNMPPTKSKQESAEATYIKHIGHIQNLMDDQELIEHMGQQTLEDYKKMGVVTLDTKEGTFDIWMQGLVGILVKKGKVKTDLHMQKIGSMYQWLSEVIKLTPAIYRKKVTKHKTLDKI